MNLPGMSFNGRRIAFFLGIVLAFMLPKKVECGAPNPLGCSVLHEDRWCTPYELEPFGFSLLERVFDRDIGFAYSTGYDCR